jgi:hypothetical protein
VEGIMDNRYAIFSKKFKQLTYFNSYNTEITVYCESTSMARTIIKKSGIEQELMGKNKYCYEIGDIVFIDDYTDEDKWSSSDPFIITKREKEDNEQYFICKRLSDGYTIEVPAVSIFKKITK